MQYQKIRDLREDHDLTQTDIAQILSCSQVCYSRYELGSRDIPTDVLIRLSNFYNVSVTICWGRARIPKDDEPDERPADGGSFSFGTIDIAPHPRTT